MVYDGYIFAVFSVTQASPFIWLYQWMFVIMAAKAVMNRNISKKLGECIILFREKEFIYFILIVKMTDQDVYTSIRECITRIGEDIRNRNLKDSYKVNDTEIDVKAIKNAVKKRIRVIKENRSGNDRRLNDDYYRDGCDQEIQRLRKKNIRLEDQLGIHEETKNLYEKLKRDYELLYGRYEMLRVQYVRVRTSSKMNGTPPSFIAGRSHPGNQDRKYITNLSKLHETEKILRAQRGISKERDGLSSDEMEDLTITKRLSSNNVREDM